MDESDAINSECDIPRDWSRRVPVRLVIPKNALVILIGAAGSGKSTFARAHFEQSQVVASAQCRELVSDDRYSRNCEDQANGLFRYCVASRLRLRKLTVADATNIRTAPRRRLLRIAQRYDAPAVGVVFDVPLISCLQGNALRKHQEPDAVIERQWREVGSAVMELEHEPFDALYYINESAIPHVVVQGPQAY